MMSFIRKSVRDSFFEKEKKSLNTKCTTVGNNIDKGDLLENIKYIIGRSLLKFLRK